jgi:hypothetical protein
MRRFLAVLFPVLLGQAAQAVTPCPLTLDVPFTVQVPPGFTAYEKGNPSVVTNKMSVTLPLAGAVFSEGAPEKSGWLTPDAGDANVNIWNFAANHDADVWVSCYYTGALLLLSQRLPAGISKCQVAGNSVGCE